VLCANVTKKAANESEIKRVSGALNKFIVKKNSTEVVEKDSESIFLHLLRNLLNNLHHRLLGAK